jgi:scyllo-inositol 2-dehydrogenase (NADP+)
MRDLVVFAYWFQGRAATMNTVMSAGPSLARPPIRVGLIGHGLSGAYFHGPLLEAATPFRIVLVATGRPESLYLRRDAPRCVRDPISVCSAADVDLVVVASPNHTHYPLGRAALEAGKHVVIDKPFALSGAEAGELIELARSRRLSLSVFQNRRLDGDFLALKRVLQDEELGEVLLFESRWDRFKKDLTPGWRHVPGPGAGLMWDLGPHLIDQALQLFGTPDRWIADLGVQRPRAAVDDYFEMTLWYGRMRCILSASISVAGARPRFAAHGTLGSYLTVGGDPYEAALRRGERPGDPAFRNRLPSIQADRIDVENQHHPLEIEAGRWEEFYPDLALGILGGTATASAAEHALGAIAMIESAHGRPG